MTAPRLDAEAREQVVHDVTGSIVELFKNPSDLPAKLAACVLDDGKWYTGWSFRNQLIVRINGYTDAMTRGGWVKHQGRCVLDELRNQEKELGYVPGGFYILKPVKKTIFFNEEDPDTGETRKIKATKIIGYEPHYVFGFEQTRVCNEKKWKQWQEKHGDAEKHINDIPFVNVMIAKGFKIRAENTMSFGAQGYYSSNEQVIAIGVKNLATPVHEFAHAIDDQCGNLTKAPGQQPDNEIVAELSAAILLKSIGLDYEADLGGCWDYVRHYAEKLGATSTVNVLKVINDLLWRVKLVVKTILEEASNFDEVEVES